MDGIQNWFVLTNIFGNAFSLVNSQIDLLKSDLLSGRMEIDFIVNCPVKHPPARWEKWDKVYIKIYFGFVEELHTRIVNRNQEFIIKAVSIEKKDQPFEHTLNIQSENGDFITAEFGMARVQNVKPLIYSENSVDKS